MTTDWRMATFLLLDKKLAKHPHLRVATIPNGDYELRCSKCGEVETYSGDGHEEIDALEFVLDATEKHEHK